MMRSSTMAAPFLPAAALACLSLAADDAEACGGFFCSSGPVDQQQETILFEVDETQTSAIVQVAYNGDPGDFSWVIPVPEVPVVDVVPALALDILNVYARVDIFGPPLSYESCEEYGDMYPSSGYGCSDYAPPSAGREQLDSETVEQRPPAVDVVELERVGPYDDIVVVSSSDPQELIDWLNVNGYVITPAMEPLIADYVAEGQKFLALKLAPDAGVQDIAPIKFTCPGEYPTIPLRLTSIAAQPHMRIAVHVVGNGRYRPLNFNEIVVEAQHLRTDLYGYRNNWDAVVAWRVDEAGGRAFVTERAGDAESVRQEIAAVSPSNDREAEAQQYLVALLERLPYLTRLYTRMSAVDMTDDPSFAPASGAPDVDGVISLEGREAVDACDPADEPEPACGFSYCGLGARCAVSDDGEEGCVCSPGRVARMVVTPTAFNPVPTIACQDPVEDMLGRDAPIADPCEGFACGQGGSCVAVNGFPTCECAEGMMAVPDAARAGGVRCAPAAASYDVARLYERVPRSVEGGDDGVSSAHGVVSCRSFSFSPRTSALACAIALLWLFARRRPRRS